MIEPVEGHEFSSLLRKMLRTKPSEESRQRLDDYVAREKQAMQEATRRIMRLGNMQITHVVPEVTVEDSKLSFDTDLFFKRCPWAKKRPEVYRMLLDFARKEKGFYIVGQTGCGKSVFTKTFAFQLMHDSGSLSLVDNSFAKFMNFGKLMECLSKDNWAYKTYILDQMRAAKHLFIDDIGSEKQSEFNDSILFSVIDSRLFKTIDGQPLKTYFSSNMVIDDLPYHARTKRRIRDMAAEVVVAPIEKQEGKNNILSSNPSQS